MTQTQTTEIVPADLADPGALPQNPDQPALGISLWDADNPQSMLSVIKSKEFRDVLIQAYNNRPELFDKDEEDLSHHLKAQGRGHAPTIVDNRMRLSFWHEFEKCQTNNRRIYATNIYGGICTEEYFYHNYLKDPEKVAWMLCPPASYVTIMEETLQFGMTQIRQVMQRASPLRKDGTVDIKLLEMYIKIIKMVDDRVKGGIVQRMESKSLEIHVGPKEAKQMMTEQGMIKLSQRIKYLESMDKTRPENHGAKAVVVDVNKGS